MLRCLSSARETCVCAPCSPSGLMVTEPSSEQQGHTVVDAATCSTTRLVQASLRHGTSKGGDRMFDHNQLIPDSHIVLACQWWVGEDWRRGNIWPC